MTVLHTLFGELSKSVKMISFASILTLIVLSVIVYFVYKQFFSPLSKFKKYTNKSFELRKDNKFIVDNTKVFSFPKTTSNDEVAKILLEYNKSNSDNKIDFFYYDSDTGRATSRPQFFALSFTKESGYSKSKLPDLINNNDITLWVLK
jgi:hypothetical protein